MDEVIEFIKRFLTAEHEEKVAGFTEKRYKKYAEKQKAVMAFFAPSVTTGFHRSPFDSDLMLDQYKSKAEKLVERPLFQIKRYQHHKFGPLYRAYVGGDRQGTEGTYDRNVYGAKVEGEWKIVAIYAINPDVDDAVQWERYRGAKIQHLGAPAEVKKIQPPTDEVDLADYETKEEEPPPPAPSDAPPTA